MKIGVLSDTHGWLDPQIPELFTGVGHILHAGDVGRPGLLAELARLAPVTAVRGNTDDPRLDLNEVELVELAGHRFLIRHKVEPHPDSESLRELLARERPAVVVFGHTHRAFEERVGDVLFLNPGYCGAPRLAQPRSVALLHCDGARVTVEFLGL